MARGMGKHPNITHAAAMYHQHLGIAPELPPLGPGANPGMAHQGSLLAQAPLAFCRPSGTIEAAADEMARGKRGRGSPGSRELVGEARRQQPSVNGISRLAVSNRKSQGSAADIV